MDILGNFDELPDDINVCQTVLRLYLRVQREEENTNNLTWWRIVYRLGKAAKSARKEKTGEIELDERGRNANLQIIDAFLFHCWMKI